MSCLGDNIFQKLTGRESCWKIEIRDVEKNVNVKTTNSEMFNQ